MHDFTPGDSSTARQCLENLRILPDIIQYAPTHYAIKCGELMGLNYLLLFSPSEIIFIDSCTEALKYTRLIVELISICDTPQEFISRVFSRPVSNFLESGETLLPFSRLQLQNNLFEEQNKLLSSYLNEFTQWRYLSTPYNTSLLKDTLGKLSNEGRKHFEKFLVPYMKGHVLFNEVKCPRLLPCWPINETIPFSDNKFNSFNIYNESEPNTNTFFYGNLWLAQTETFQVVKQKLKKTNVSYIEFDPLKDPITIVLPSNTVSALYFGKLNQQNISEQIQCKERWKNCYQMQPGLLCVITGDRHPEIFFTG